MKSRDLKIVESNEDADSVNSSFTDDDELSSFADHMQEKEKLPEIAKKETAAVNRLKVLVLITLSIPTVAIACAIFFYVSYVEEEEFKSAYLDDAEKIVDNFGKNLDVLLEATGSLAVATVSYAHSTNQTWPFVTLPDFASRASTIKSLAKTVWIAEYCMVPAKLRAEWEAYAKANNGWVNDAIAYQKNDKTWKGPIIWNYTTFDVIHDWGEYEKPPEEQGLVGTNYTTDVYFPNWQNSPIVPSFAPYNWDLNSIEDIEFIYDTMVENNVLITYPYLGQVYKDPEDEAEVEEMGYEAQWIADYIDPSDAYRSDEPVADLIYPIITNIDGSTVKDGIYTPSSKLTSVGLYSITYYWRELLRDILPDNSNGIHVVFESCRPPFTYQVNGAETVYLGAKDFHEEKYDFLEISSKLLDLTSPTYTGVPVNADSCPYTIRVYPSDTFREQYTSSNPVIITICAVVLFALFNTLVFLVYDRLVQRRNRIVVNKANRTRKIVSNLFPETVHKELFGDDDDTLQETATSSFVFISPKDRLSSFLAESPSDCSRRESGPKKIARPIAEVFTDTTVMFADIVGFTAWSSVREPFQVFTLLETVYGAFDVVAKRRGVFKVETVGDSYVAASGVPEPRENHAIVMAKFAAKCRSEMNRVTRELEVSLGPETGDLRMRFGLHTGSVTAGVLRGDKARFQLFGDTVNTAARMESTGIANQIHISKKTADLIVANGFQNWITARVDLVEAKGIGNVQTYFVHPKRGTSSLASSVYDGGHLIAHSEMHDMDEKLDRLVNWMVEVFGNLLKCIQAQRGSQTYFDRSYDLPKGTDGPTMVRDEVQEIIELPDFDDSDESLEDDINEAELDEDVEFELREYITQIALKYNHNAFHNFEHACQVTMATRKLLSRIVAPNDVAIKEKKDLYDNTYGITSDPLTQFAVVFSSLIHDVDHPGVSNQQLAVEKTAVALRYDGKSVSEQHSVDLAWEMLMEPVYSNLRAAIFSNDVEFKRFRQLIVNSVMATDIFDKELKAIRDGRWNKAFDEETKRMEGATRIFANRRATIVIEHIIQASDIAHCMQHWKVYQRWNKRLFFEMFAAFNAGRLGKDPAESWYKGELWFFDNYIVPLAKKLKTCGVFGVSCDEFLDCAVDNRNEWAERGQEITAQFLADAQAQDDQWHEEE